MWLYPAENYLLKVNNRNSMTMHEKYSRCYIHQWCSCFFLLRHSRWLAMKLLLVLYEPLMNHFRSFEFISTQLDVILQLDLILRNFEGISSLTYNNSPPIFLWNLYWTSYLFKINYAEGNGSQVLFLTIK